MKDMHEIYREKFFQTYDPLDYVPVKGLGTKLWDASGHEVIDLSGGIAVTCLGQCHPALVQALQEQSEKLWHVSNIVLNEPAMLLAEKLIEKSCFDRCFFINSGTEAVESALKLARRSALVRYGKDKHHILSFKNSFHGRTLFAVSAGGQEKYSKEFVPLPGGISHSPYNDLASAEKLINKDTAAVIIEPIQGEGGVLPADPAFLQGLRALCDEHGAALIFDEIQTGVGRTGKLFAYETYGVEPDIMTLAKGLGGGIPIGAVLAREPFASGFSAGSHGTTFGGNPLACAVGNKVLDIVSQEAFLQGVEKRAKLLWDGLSSFVADGYFSELRGKGLLLGAVFAGDMQGKAFDFVKIAPRHGVFVLAASDKLMRLAPALNIEFDDLERALDCLGKALKAFRAACALDAK